jgi:hypothetical protein
MHAKVVEDYVQLFENAQSRTRSIDALYLLVGDRIQNLDILRSKLRYLHEDIGKLKSSQTLELDQLNKLSLAFDQLEELVSQLTPQEVEFINRTKTKPKNIDSKSSIKSSSGQNLESNHFAPPLHQIQRQSTGTTPCNMYSKSASSDDDTLFFDAEEPSSFVQDVTKYYPKLIVTRPDTLRTKDTYTVPNLDLQIDRNDYFKVVMLQNIYILLGVPFELWGTFIGQHLKENLHSDYLQLSTPPTWYEVIYLLFANQDMFINNSYKVEEWTRTRPQTGQTIHNFLHEVKHKVEACQSKTSFDVERSIIISQLNPAMLSKEMKLTLQSQNRQQFYSFLFSQFPESMTFTGRSLH